MKVLESNTSNSILRRSFMCLAMIGLLSAIPRSAQSHTCASQDSNNPRLNITNKEECDTDMSQVFIDQSVIDLPMIELCQSEVFQLFSHGKPGMLLLEKQWRDANEIAEWLGTNQLLKDKSHLNIYGCNFAQGEKGRASVEYLEATLGVSVAASDDVTGKKGDWNLEIGEEIHPLQIANYQYNLSSDSYWDNLIDWFKNFWLSEDKKALESHLSLTSSKTELDALTYVEKKKNGSTILTSEPIKGGMTSMLSSNTDCQSRLPISTLCTITSGCLGGNVFEDFNCNGAEDTNEPGVQGIAVQIYDCDNNLVGTVNSEVEGDWQVCGLTDGTAYRVEFTLPSAVSSWATPTHVGLDNMSDVQFLTAPACTQFSVSNPADYCTEITDLVLSCYEVGSGQGANATNAALVSFDYDSATGDSFAKDVEMTIGDAGSTWGVAWEKDAKRIFASSVLKRSVGFGEGTNSEEPGYIYFQEHGVSPSTLHKFNLQGVVPANSVNPLSGGTIDLGSITRNRVTGSIGSGAAGDFDISDNPLQATRDLDAFGKAGTMSFGDIDVTEDQQYLWAVNLHQKALVQIDLVATATLDGATGATLSNLANQYLIEQLSGCPVCGNGDGTIPYNTGGNDPTTVAGTQTAGNNDAGVTGQLRPWALEFHDGVGYLGLVCDASISKDIDDLAGYVLSFDPNNIAGGFATELTMNLDYFKQHTYIPNGLNYIEYHWQPWEDVWDNSEFTGNANPPSNLTASRSTPILSDIEFDANDGMILGFMDRWGLQNTHVMLIPESGNTDFLQYHPHGELMYACNNNGTYEFEGTGSCPQNYQVKPHISRHFDLERGDGRPFGALGATEICLVSGELVATFVDPLPPNTAPNSQYFNQQGLHYYNAISGGNQIDYAVVTGSSSLLTVKGQALGDIEKLCDSAPLEIGNYVWCDSLVNGIQDACEQGISDIIVQLYDRNGILVAQDTTVNGQYYFNENNVDTTGITVAAGVATPVTAWSGMSYATQYFIVFGGGQFATNRFTVGSDTYGITSMNDAGSNDNIDSDVDDTSLTAGTLGSRPDGLPFIDMMTSETGCGEHKYDLGVTCCTTDNCFEITIIRN